MFNKDTVKDLTGRVIKRYDQEVVDVKLASHESLVVSSLANGHMSKSDKSKLDGIQAGAQVNQNAFANIKIGDTTLVADSKQDTFSITAGTNVTITADGDNDSIVISSKDTIYTHPGSGTNPHGTTKVDIGLGNVTNESKQTMFTNAALTGTPTAPTASKGTNSTQIATTAFVASAVSNLTAKGHTHNSSEITAMTSYAKATSASAISTSDSLNTAIGKLERALDDKSDNHDHPYRPDTWVPQWSEIQNKPSLESPTGAQEKATAALNSAKAYADAKVADLVNSAPEALDTLQELSQALGDDPNFATTITNKIGLKADTSYVNSELTKKANTSHSHSASNITDMNGYTKATTAAAISTTDTLNVAIGKLEKALDGKANSSHNHTWAQITDRPSSLPANGGNSDTVGGKTVDDSKTDTSSLWTASKINTEIAKKANTTHNHNASQITTMTGYAKPSSTSAISDTDTLNSAIGKLEYGLGSHTHNYRAGDWVPTFAQVTSKPTTLSGYGITDAASKSNLNSLTTRVANIENRLDTEITETDIDDIMAFIKG